MFIEDAKESKESNKKRIFQMKCLSYDRKDLNKYFKKMNKKIFVYTLKKKYFFKNGYYL